MRKSGKIEKITKEQKFDLLENIKGNTTWFNSDELAIFKSIVKDILNK